MTVYRHRLSRFAIRDYAVAEVIFQCGKTTRKFLLTQGAEQMSKFGVNVPPGVPVFSLDEVDAAAEKMRSPDGQVGSVRILRPCFRVPCSKLWNLVSTLH